MKSTLLPGEKELEQKIVSELEEQQWGVKSNMEFGCQHSICYVAGENKENI
jgi:hypothetical protein